MIKKYLDYKDISLAPRKISTLASRSEANMCITFGPATLSIPIIASPMPDVCDGLMARQLAELGALGIIHRFQTVNDQVQSYIAATLPHPGVDLVGKSFDDTIRHAACAIGIVGDYKTRYKALYAAGCRIFCLDTANGSNIQVGAAIHWIRSLTYSSDQPWETTFLIAGNVATAEGYSYLAQAGADAVRVGIAGGSVCETKTETGVYVPMISAIQECAAECAKDPNKKWPLIIADGGIKTPADLCKALAAGADLVMCGSIFAGTEEAPGEVINDGGKLLKLYRGAASFGVQAAHHDKEPDYVEGRETFVPYKGKVSKVIKRFKGGLASSMSYMNARTLTEFKANIDIIHI